MIDATKGMVLLPGLEEEHEHEGGEEHHHEYDPHLWLSPHRAMKMVSRFVISWWQLIQIRKRRLRRIPNLSEGNWRLWIQAYQDGLKMRGTKEFCNLTQLSVTWLVMA